MEFLHTIWATPGVQMVAYTIVGVILAKLLFPYLEKLVKKTPSLTDDEYLAKTEAIVVAALDKKLKKLAAPATTAAAPANTDKQ